MRNTMIRTMVAVSVLGASLAMGTGCASKTEGERTLDQSKQMEDAGQMISRGEQEIREGKAMEAKGKAAKDQGDQVEGNRQISEGQAMQRKGQADIDAGRKLKSGM